MLKLLPRGFPLFILKAQRFMLAVLCWNGYVSSQKNGWILHSKQPLRVVLLHPSSINYAFGDFSPPSMGGVIGEGGCLFLHPHLTSPIKGEELIFKIPLKPKTAGNPVVSWKDGRLSGSSLRIKIKALQETRQKIATKK